MKNVALGLVISFWLVILLTGCKASEVPRQEISEEENQVCENVSEERIDEVESIVSESDTTSEDSTKTEELSEMETMEVNNEGFFVFDENTVVDYENTLYALEFSYYKTMERVVVIDSYLEGYPKELQDVLVEFADDILDEGELLNEYRYEGEVITKETAGDIPFDAICKAISDVYGDASGIYSSMKAVDIDGDGVDEYFVEQSVGIGRYVHARVVKEIDGEWVLIGSGGMFDTAAYNEVLECNGKLYLLYGNELSYWDATAEQPDWSESMVPGSEEPWKSIQVCREITGYTPTEIYSADTEDTYDYLKDVDLTDLETNKEIEADFRDCWFVADGNSYDICFGWTTENDENRYQYVISENHWEGVRHGLLEDKVLTIFKINEDGKKELVKVYHLAANYNMYFQDVSR